MKQSLKNSREHFLPTLELRLSSGVKQQSSSIDKRSPYTRFTALVLILAAVCPSPGWCPPKRDNASLDDDADDSRSSTLRQSLVSKELKEDDIPQAFLCPISCSIMCDPVKTPNGDTYERESITRWINSVGNDPTTRTSLNTNMLLPNHTLKNEIENWKKARLASSSAVTLSEAAPEELLQEVARLRASLREQVQENNMLLDRERARQEKKNQQDDADLLRRASLLGERLRVGGQRSVLADSNPRDLNSTPNTRGTNTALTQAVSPAAERRPVVNGNDTAQIPVPVASSGAVDRPLARDIVIPEIARGYEDVYIRFLMGRLIYQPDRNSDTGRAEFRIRDFVNPLEGTFDLSRCGDTGQYVNISSGYRKGITLENTEKLEIWIVPQFLIRENLAGNAAHFQPIMANWSSSAAPVGLFWTWGGWDKLCWYDYLTTSSWEQLGEEDLLKKWGKSKMRHAFNYPYGKTALDRQPGADFMFRF